MRKGRSSRRSRIPRPISVVPPSTPALSAELRPASAPHVVLGVSPSEPPASREPERSSREAEGARFTSGAVVVTEALATEILAERDAHDVSAKEIAADDGGEVPRAAANDFIHALSATIFPAGCSPGFHG